jgi:hypothetical protein
MCAGKVFYLLRAGRGRGREVRPGSHARASVLRCDATGRGLTAADGGSRPQRASVEL